MPFSRVDVGSTVPPHCGFRVLVEIEARGNQPREFRARRKLKSCDTAIPSSTSSTRSKNGALPEPFDPKRREPGAGIRFAGTFLPKHRVGNPGGNTPLFVRVSEFPALYR